MSGKRQPVPNDILAGFTIHLLDEHDGELIIPCDHISGRSVGITIDFIEGGDKIRFRVTETTDA